MNRKINLFCLVASLFWFGFSPSARAYHNGIVAISGSIIEELTNENYVNHTRKASWSTATFLQQLARDEHMAGQWDRDTFPQGSSLQFDGANFVVVSGTNIIVVSNVMNISLSLAAQNQSGIAATTYSTAILNFDDSASTGQLVFSVNAIVTDSTSYTDPYSQWTKTGPLPKQTDILTLQSGTGAGYLIESNGLLLPFAVANLTLNMGPLVRPPVNLYPSGGGGFSDITRRNPMHPRVPLDR